MSARQTCSPKRRPTSCRPQLERALERIAEPLAAGVCTSTPFDLFSGSTGPTRASARFRSPSGWRAVATLLVDHRSTSTTTSAVAPPRSRAARLAANPSRAELEAEALRRSDSLKTALLHAVSHDLRSPLTAIVAAASSLANPQVRLDADDRDDLIATIRAEADRLNRLVGNLLDLSRLQGGVVEPHLELWPVDELVARALEQLGRRGDRVDVELGVDAPPVDVDAVQIERSLVNLLDNALKFSPQESRVRLHVEATGTTCSCTSRRRPRD